jgi:hypothetical protein
MGLGSIFSRVVPAALGFASGGPAGAITAVVGTEQAKKREKLEGARQLMYQNDPGISQGFSGVQPSTASSGSGSFFGNLGQSIGSFGTGVGQFFQDIQPATQFFGLSGPKQRMAPQAATSIIRQAPDETSTSGEILGANLGLGSNILQAAGRFVRSPGGQAALGFGAGAVGAALSGGANGAPRITRKMKSDVRRIYMMAGMDPNVTAQILNNMGTYPRIEFDANVVFFILTKRFRNDGPVVTKAAVRKTKTTLRRMKGVVDMYNSVCKPTTRRAPARRAAPKAVQLIKN